MYVNHIAEKLLAKKKGWHDILEELPLNPLQKFRHETERQHLFFNISQSVFSLRLPDVDPLFCDGPG